jgi:hypothetical protein
LSTARVIRYIIGVIIAAIVLSILLPVVGIPRSHFLPPAMVYNKADGIARGYLTAKYYDITGNPFDVGGRQFFIRYKFRAKSPGPKGAPDGGPVMDYDGVMRLSDADKGVYDTIPITIDKSTADKTVNQVNIPTYPVPIKVRYEKTYPYINGIIGVNGSDAPWGNRNIGEGSNNSSGWIMYIFVTLAVGYGFMMLIERFGNTENI